MIDLEHAQPETRVRIAQTERVEAGAEHDGLPDAAADGLSETILGKACARGHEQPHPSAMVVIGRLRRGLDGRQPEDGAGERVLKDRALFEGLVRRAMQRRAPGRAAELVFDHAAQV